MTTDIKTKQLIAILVATAWLDGVIQPQERKYLHKIVSENNLQDDRDIKLLLSEIKPVTVSECYQWLEEYLGDNPTTKDYEELLGSISALIYSDSDVHTQEAKLLNHLQHLDPQFHPSKPILEQVLESIRKLYHQSIVK